MFTPPKPELRHGQTILLAGTMAIFDSQAEASEKIPQQWRKFLALPVPEIHTATKLYGASPCTSDGKIHFLCGIEVPNYDGVNSPARLVLEAGEYAVITVHDIADLRDTWVWALSKWLPASGHKERNAPEFEVYTAGPFSAPVEMWIPLEP